MDIVQYGNTDIHYSVVYSERKTLGIVVHPDGSVIVKAPIGILKEKVSEKVKKRASWIIKQQNFFKSFGKKMPQRRYISGESHLYLGRQYRLYVKEGKPNSVSFKGRCFEIVCTSKDKAESLMTAWYKERAKVKFAEIAEPIIQQFKKYGVEPKSLYIQAMENRWGSCTAKQKIILNTELIKAPKPCIEYVITHEMCHLLHKNHTKAFYELLTNEMPDWEKWKNKLERML
ncbi:MAG: M48 family metallopeptidase [Bacteroidales bacterium]|jgi:predicted metal-dependent hydrolase|nr:M48 family metallopeptidase [Bacteroidales bacterium]MDY0174896.1 SprT family zinc-dependent metalloprotease [Bacteroidales bacterium]